jgi:cysteine desulfurase
MHEIYLDNNATTKPDPEVIKAMMPYLEEKYGNASALHKKGAEAERAVHEARRAIADALGAHENEIIFTSGGTESNNLAIKGLARARARRGNRIIITKVEHQSIIEPCKELEKEGFTIDYLDVTKNGINPDQLKNLVNEKTILISVMHINNETGQIFPINELAKIAKEKNPNVIFHSDGMQAIGKMPVDVPNIDLYSINGHKIHAPQGIGALYIKNTKEEMNVNGTTITKEAHPLIIKPLITGGGQEQGLRAGTINVPGIVAFGKAMEIANAKLNQTKAHLKNLGENLIQGAKGIPGITLNIPEHHSPSTLNLGFPPIPAEVLLHALEEKGIYVGTGSACASRDSVKNVTLTAMGYPKEIINASVRISLSRMTTESEIEKTIKALKEVAIRLHNTIT